MLGFSQGTGVVTSVARHQPDIVDALVLLSGIAVPSDDENFHNENAWDRDFPVFVGKDQRDRELSSSLIAFTNRWLSGFSDLTFRRKALMGNHISDE